MNQHPVRPKTRNPIVHPVHAVHAVHAGSSPCSILVNCFPSPAIGTLSRRPRAHSVNPRVHNYLKRIMPQKDGLLRSETVKKGSRNVHNAVQERQKGPSFVTTWHPKPDSRLFEYAYCANSRRRQSRLRRR
jgi:hypothetical protein